MNLSPTGQSFNFRPFSKSGLDLLQQGVTALSTVESNGFRIDTEYLEGQLKKIKRKENEYGERLRKDEVWRTWRKKFGTKAKLSSKEQLADILFNVMGSPITSTTGTGKPKGDEEHIATVNIPFVRGYIRLSKLGTLKNKLLGIQRETVDGYLHAVYNLHIAKTFRSSSDSPNFQNMPIRDPWMGKVIRRCFIPRPGHVIVEVDYSGIEVRVAACYHKDPVMIKYITDPLSDMHRDMAAQIFKLPMEQVSKAARHSAKNQFVFPQFYGDYFINNAKAMWGSVTKFDLQTVDGIRLDKHLATQGITSRGECDGKERAKPGTFEHHMKSVEDDFWNNRFGVYGNWKKDWWKSYQRQGGFDTLTGFRIDGMMAKNDVINYPVQGSAFHCLLWALIQMEKFIRKNRMRTKLVGQIHDSIVADVHISELDDYLQNVRRIMCDDITGWAPWLNVPLDVEAEITPVEGTWFDKHEITFENDGYGLDGISYSDTEDLLNNIQTEK